MSGKRKENLEPRIANRKALHDYFISAKIECGIVLVGSEVKSLRAGRAQLQDAWVAVEHGQLILHGAHIDPYEKAASVYNHEPRRDRKLLAHRREIKRLANETAEKATTLIPLAIYFKGGRAKIEIGVAKGKQQHDKRDTIKRKEMDRELRRTTMTHRT
ncbi:MAG TPA: SsrA-binding protein SmpB [Tepidisphaeraceae bacterium]|jgi:SsrA-binding protein|nr:SsrA-binding protein SmpB [Tepidisphaeraceae bacterium]